jgi:putative tryptophan/tyrosine transport system substrate-binding protein
LRALETGFVPYQSLSKPIRCLVLSLGADMRRREFLSILSGAAATWPLKARAQQATMPVVGFLHSVSLANLTRQINAFRQGLKETGFVEGQTVVVESRSADDRHDRLPALVADLIRRQAVVIAGNSIAMLAAKSETNAIPLVFASGADPIKLGLVVNLNRPGGNVTGATFFAGVLGAKRLELLHQIVPKATNIAMLMHPDTAETQSERADVQVAAQAIGKQVIVLDARGDSDIEAAFATMVERRVDALLVGAGAFLTARRERIVALAARYGLPASYSLREFAASGGLMSYGTSITDAYRQVGVYTGRVLKGEKPADLPVMQSSKFEFVINLKTAKMLGLEFHPQLLATADEVIE